MTHHRFPLISADASSVPPLADQYMHATPDSWEKYDPGDNVGAETFSRGGSRKRAFAHTWGAYIPGDDGPR
jgi:hypothetical protein